jgi:hypothetical protein
VDKLRQPVSPSKKSSGKAKGHNPGDNSSKQSGNRVDVAILGDSMLKFINPSKLRKSSKRNVLVKTFPGAKVNDMKHYVKPTTDKTPDHLILHVGTND